MAESNPENPAEPPENRPESPENASQAPENLSVPLESSHPEPGETILPRVIEQEMKEAYVNYAMSVIVGRALPDVRDGLKPVHRRILYAMHEMGLQHNKPFKKSARITGDTMGKYHPHGDIAVYDALVRMAQEFSLRYPLIKGQGNFGCFTGDTKVKLTDGRDLTFWELIEEQKHGRKNYTYTVNTEGCIEIAEIKNPRLTKKNEQIIKVVLDNGEEIRCTFDHRFMLRDGTYREASQLTLGNSLMPLYLRPATEATGVHLALTVDQMAYQPISNEWVASDCIEQAKVYNHKVVMTELLSDREDVYDLTIEDSHNFALAAGVFVHNSIDGDPAAHQRYTEAKLHKLAEEMLADIEKETVIFRDNFDGSLQEPTVLPSKIPNLLINGSSGIAVGMATNIPPHNVQEVCDGIIATIDHPELTVEELMQIIPAPDFPTGAEVVCGAGLVHAYTYGKGKVIIKAIMSVEKNKIIVSEIPYQVNKEELIEQIAELVKDKRIVGIKDINDESDREGIRVVIELKQDADSAVIINQLYQYSNLQLSFGIQFLALVDNQPKLLGLKEIIEHHIGHRQDVIVRRTQYDLTQAQEKVHILEGLLVALNNLDSVIPGIRNSKTVDDARQFLLTTYALTEIQAKAILEMRLQKLASLEQDKIRDEHQELLKQIIFFQEILASKQKVLSLIKAELQKIKEEYGDPRRSRIIMGGEDDVFEIEDLVKEETMVVTITHAGYLKRLPLDTYKTQRRGGKGVIATGMKEEDFVEKMYIASTHDYLLFFTDQGQLHWLKVYQVPEASRQAKGKHISQVIALGQEKITAVIPVRDFKDGYLFMATEQGTVKKTALQEFANPRRGGIRAITIDEGDSLVGVKYTAGNNEIIVATKLGSANRFNEEDVRPIGRQGRGVRGIRLDAGDAVIGLLAAEEGKDILTLTEKGYGKRTPVSEYRLCNRGGKGVTNIKITEKNGSVSSVMIVDGTEELMLISKNGVAIRLKCSDISQIGRATQGVRVMKLEENDQLAAAAMVVMETEMESNGS